MADRDRDDLEFGATEKPVKKKSGALTVLLWIFGIGVLLSLLCCGGGALLFYMNVPIYTTPAAIDGLKDKIVRVDVPQNFKPKFGMSMGPIKMVFYGDDSSEGSVVMLMEMTGASAADKDNLKRQLEQQQAQQQKGNQQLTTIETDTKTYTIRGEECEFTISKMKNEKDQEFRQVMGTFPTNGGAGIVMIMVREENFDQEEIDEIIGSIE